MKYLAPLLLAVILSGCGSVLQPDSQQTDTDQKRPNILLITADDMGMADMGAFGSEIATPNLDALAYAGVRFTRFHASPACSPSRVMLFTGVDGHRAGLGNMAEELAPNQKGKPGYEGYMNHRVVTVPTLMRDAGYNTYFSGKWHLGMTEETGPAARGFERSFAMLTGGAHHFSDMKPAYSPDPKGIAPYREGHQMLTELPDDYQYSSQYLVDRLIDYFEADKPRDKPFFAVLSFMAPHWPLQAPRKAIEKQHGRYDEGYDVIAERRLQRQRELGIIGKNGLVPIPPEGARWETLNKEQRRWHRRAMEIYAAMIEQLDYHSGRLFDYMKANGLMENTVVVFLSDNGAEGHNLDGTWPHSMFPQIRKVIEERHDFSYENMGHPNSYVLYGPNWARAGAPATRLHKAFVNEGGIRVPAFIYYPAKVASGIHRGQFHIRDLASTMLSIADVSHPGNSYKGRSVEPMTGIDMMPYIGRVHRQPPERVEVYELMGKRYVMDYPWKSIFQPVPYGKGRWELYHLGNDLSETKDLAERFPDKLKELIGHWEAYVIDNNVILPDWVSGY